MPTLVVKYKDGSRTYPLREGVPVFIGRAKECDIHLPSPAVSRRHAVVIYKNGICGIKDLGSFNGTLLNGTAITAAEHLTEVDVVQISSFIFRLDASDIEVRPKPGPRKGTTVLMPQEKLQAALNALNDPDEAPAADMPTDPEPARGAPFRQDSASFLNSNLRLPRAMGSEGEVEKILENYHEQGRRDSRSSNDTRAYSPGADTVVFTSQEGAAGVSDTQALSSFVSGGSPDSTAEMESPEDFARSLAREAQEDLEAIMPARPPDSGGAGDGTDTDSTVHREGDSWFDTDYFRDEPEPEEEGAVHEELPDEPVQDAEQVIPLNEPEYAPQLTLEWDDDETNRALAALVADVSRDVSAYRDGFAGVKEEPAAAAPRDETELSAPASEEDDDPDVAVPAEPDEDGGDDESDVENGEENGDEPGQDSDPVVAETVNDTSFLPVDDAFFTGQAAVPGVEAILVPPTLMTAINARLFLHSLLFDLAEERKLFRLGHPNLSAAAVAELDRQEAELASLPTADEAERMLDARAAQGNSGDGDLERALEMAESQWHLVRDSNRDALPAIFKEAYKLGADEPLARELSAARINHGRLFGGALYLLALEVLSGAAQAERKDIAARMRRLADKGLEKESGGLLGKLGRLGDTVNKVKHRNEIREETRRLEEQDRESALFIEHTLRESAFMEKTLIREFHHVYSQTAAHFIRKDGEMPLAVRAFLRYGVIGFKPWWMRADVRDFIQRDCRDNVVSSIEAGAGLTTVLYADEYLAAVANMECAPFPDESLAGRERNSPERKTDRAYRRIVNARSYNILMEEMLGGLDVRLRDFDEKSAALEKRVDELKARPFANGADAIFGLETERQAIAIRKSNLQKHIKRIETEVVASILEAVEESEGRFRRGELHMPDGKTLVAREVESIADIARRVGGPRRRFMPLTMRESMVSGPAAINDRDAVAARVGDIERADPGVFVSTIIPAKKRENRVELRLSPVVVIYPGTGLRGLCAAPREGMEGGHLAVPVCFSKEGAAESAFSALFADFRWETSRMLGGRDIMNSETLAGEFMRFRWEWRNEAKARREKGFVHNELSDKRNWRRVYAAYLSDASRSTRQLAVRNPALYERVIVPYLG